METVTKKPLGGINGLTLKIIAVILMLCDHLSMTVIAGHGWLHSIGRLAFPIFAFLLVEGYFHTKNVKKYALRLLAFAFISEIPFDMMKTAYIFDPFSQNVFWTLLIGLLVIWAMDKAKEKGTVRYFVTSFIAITLGCLVSFVFMTDYLHAGVLTIILFYMFRGYNTVLFFGLIVINNLLGGEVVVFDIMGRQYELAKQTLAALAMCPIWLYNGKRGYSNKFIQYGFYAFYPIHMLIIGLSFYL